MGGTRSIRIDPSFNKQGEPDWPEIQERRKFWDSPDTVQWFEDRGYTLYRRVLDDDGNRSSITVPARPSQKYQDADYPYAYHDGNPSREGLPPLGENEFYGKVVFAQDSQNRHVAIKIVRDGSNEYRVLRFLSQQNLDDIQGNCIIPVLELLPTQGFWFVVMPRWGSIITSPTPDKAYEILDIMYSLLKGLAFLHEHNITHGDIKLSNVLVNHFTDPISSTGNEVRRRLRAQRLLLYAMFDFDFSIILPPGADRTTYRLPYERSWGSFNLTTDTSQGEFDFNPFVLDVGALGAVFCAKFQHLCGQIPFLAPLLDRMTTRFLANRFSASEALHFFEKMYSQLTDAELRQEVEGLFPGEPVPYYEYDRWQLVPSNFAREWSSYREPPIPLTTKLLRIFCQWLWILHAIAYVRWFSYEAKSVIWNGLVGRLWPR